jgi:hypothetical protein
MFFYEHIQRIYSVCIFEFHLNASQQRTIDHLNQSELYSHCDDEPKVLLCPFFWVIIGTLYMRSVFENFLLQYEVFIIQKV